MDVILDRQPEKYLERLNEPTLSRIVYALEKLSHEPPEGDIKPLAGQKKSFRLRVGGYRILFKEKETCMAVYKIIPRGQVYKE